MEAIGHILKPYAGPIAMFAGGVTMVQIFSGVFLLNDVRKKGTNEGVPAIPFLGGIILSVISLEYGLILGDDAMIKVNSFGFALNIIYFSYYYIYTPKHNKTKIWIQIFLTTLISIGCILYGKYEDPKVAEFRFGLILTAFILLFVSSPLFSIGDVIKTQSTESLPLPIILSGTITCFAWLLHGFATINSVIVMQNAVLLGISLIQLSFFVIYPRKPASKAKSLDKKTK